MLASALVTDPDSAEAHATLGGIHLENGQSEEARHQFEEAIRLQNNLASAHYQLGLVFQKQGKTEEAAHQFRAALEANPAGR